MPVPIAGAGILVVFAIRLIAALAKGSTSGGGGSGGQPRPTTNWGGRTVLWTLVAVGWGATVLGTAFWALDPEPHALDTSVELGLADVLGIAYLWFAWPILRWATRHLSPKAVYYLGHVALLFPRTGETQSGACLLAGLAMLHRGTTTKEERTWLQDRIEKERYPLGVFGAALAVSYVLRSGASRRRGRIERADEFALKARSLFGTITYMSELGAPKPIKRLAEEYFALLCASRGIWGGVGSIARRDLPRALRPLSDWVRTNLLKEKVERRFRDLDFLGPAEKLPFVRELERRELDPPEPTTAEVIALTLADHRRLLAGQELGARRVLNLLSTLDVLFSPGVDGTFVEPAIAADEELLGQLHDDVAADISKALRRLEIPLHALKRFGPISARVMQAIERDLLDELEQTLKKLEERRKDQTRYDGKAEWLEVSHVRTVYRRVEYVLGEAAVARAWRATCFAYCSLGVLLSEYYPRMRPLAFAVFSCLHREAVRFSDEQNASLMLRNMEVTKYVA